MPTKEEQDIIRKAADLDPAFAKKIGLATRDIRVILDTPINGASVINDAWVQIGNTRVSQVPVGGNFDIWVNATLINQGGGRWGACLTAIDPTGQTVKNYQLIAALTLGGTTMNTGDTKLSGNGANVMPNGTGTLTLRIRGWMTDTSTPATPPDQSSW